MSDLPNATDLAFFAAEAVPGLWLLWRLALSPAARRREPRDRLAPWAVSGANFLVFLWLVIFCGIFVQAGVAELLKRSSIDEDPKLILTGGAFHLGMLVGVLVFRWRIDQPQPAPPAAPTSPWLAGLVTFLIALPLVSAVSVLWQLGLDAVGLPNDEQELVGLFSSSQSPSFLALMTAFAVLVAPVTEELVFRFGIFRYARGRLPHWAALLIPAILFGALHLNLASFAPLVMLGLVFSLAYERTGHIGTSMVAHALFNLHTIGLILAGVGN